jgi:hypothetical protein
MTLGWECPKCGAVMAPHVNCCVNCRGEFYYCVTECDHDYLLVSSSAGSWYKCQKCGKEIPVTITYTGMGFD